LAAWLPACGRTVFHHTEPATSDDAGGPESSTCQDDGERCDDRDVCTPASTCRAGRCVAGNAVEACDVADTIEDFGEVQGQNGWYYGYWSATEDGDGSYDGATDFAHMVFCSDGNWRPPEQCGLSEDDPDHVWTMNLAWGLQHPEAMRGLQVPVRRWISDVSGPAQIRAHHHVDGEYGDGTRALLLIDGDEIWRNDAEAGDTTGVQVALDVELERGTIVEQLVHPIDGSVDDTTFFAIVIEGR
jgi:hypothetical protein